MREIINGVLMMQKSELNDFLRHNAENKTCLVDFVKKVYNVNELTAAIFLDLLRTNRTTYRSINFSIQAIGDRLDDSVAAYQIWAEDLVESTPGNKLGWIVALYNRKMKMLSLGDTAKFLYWPDDLRNIMQDVAKLLSEG